MANWKNTIDLTDVWESEDARLIAGAIATRLCNLSPYTDEEVEYKRLDLAEAFKDAALDEDLNVHAFNSLMSELYDWGDNDHSCWIQTF
ncbi:MAG: hypothetical protein IPK44_01110 [Candidatus Accumulibacter sp.]|uniref:hypothetical protein n=1 Tax=Accumulibacter sp. TaxID=2053492 RepID=UPI002589680B|nr:hypothetical protein [Accumulibacter sp.]MBK8113197.1 hypothetical protein [Accumulibacter sp.]